MVLQSPGVELLRGVGRGLPHPAVGQVDSAGAVEFAPAARARLDSALWNRGDAQAQQQAVRRVRDAEVALRVREDDANGGTTNRPLELSVNGSGAGAPLAAAETW